MKIAFLYQPNDPYTEVRIKYFVSKGYEVFSIVFNTKIKQKPLLDVTIIPLHYNPLAKIPFFKRIIYANTIRDITAKSKIDILYVISALNSYYLKASKASYNILEIQGSDVITSPSQYPFLKYFYKHFWKYADGITQDSDLAKQKAKSYFPKNIVNETIEIGVDLSVFNSDVEKGLIRKKYNLENRPLIFHSRGIAKLYNLDIIIKSIPIVKKQFDNVCFMFTGDINDLNNASKNFIQTHNLRDNIIFCGWLNHETEMKYYNIDADLMVSIPSSDSSPFSVYEAMAVKTPVIVSDLPWFKGKFINGKHLIAVPAQDEMVLAQSIIKLINKEVELDIESAYSIVFNKINMLVENKKLEGLFENAIVQNN